MIKLQCTQYSTTNSNQPALQLRFGYFRGNANGCLAISNAQYINDSLVTNMSSPVFLDTLIARMAQIA